MLLKISKDFRDHSSGGCGDKKVYYETTTNGEKDDYDGENSWISDGLSSSSRRRLWYVFQL